MDITKSVLRKLGKANIPPTVLPSIYPGKIKFFKIFILIINK
jgi:hypothetical protein